MAETEVVKQSEKNGCKSEVASELETSIIRQLEYYFGDSNLYRDKFLQEQIKKDAGWVDIKTLLTFKRLQALSEDPKVIVDSIQKSDEGLIEVHEDKTKIRRHPERPLVEQNEEVRKEIVSRTVYVKGFPLDSDMDSLINFFNNRGKVVNIVMRKYHDKNEKVYKFKGSVFVTFADKEQGEEFVKLEKIEYKDVALIKKWQEQYNEEKREERNSQKQKKIADEKPEDAIELAKGAVLNLDGFDPEATREMIRTAFQDIVGDYTMVFIEFEKGQSSGHIRFAEENAAIEVFKKITDGKVTVNDKEITVRLLEGDEEEKYLKEQVQNIRARRKQMNEKHRLRGRKPKFTKKRKATDEDNDDEPRKKK